MCRTVCVLTPTPHDKLSLNDLHEKVQYHTAIIFEDHKILALQTNERSLLQDQLRDASRNIRNTKARIKNREQLRDKFIQLTNNGSDVAETRIHVPSEDSGTTTVKVSSIASQTNALPQQLNVNVSMNVC